MANETKHENAEAVVEAVSKTDLFFKENRKTLLIILAVLVVAGAVFFCYHKFVYEVQRAEAQEQMYPAENNFRNAEYELALNGDGNVLGFAQIIDEYGAKAGKSVYFYAGVCELQLGNPAEAIDYLTKYNGKDPVLKARALSCIGDAYSMSEDYESALRYYLQAADVEDNTFAASYLLKAGIICEELGRPDEALAHYRVIKDKYPQSYEGYEIDKYITRIEVKK